MNTCYDRDDNKAYNYVCWNGENNVELEVLFGVTNHPGVREVVVTQLVEKVLALDIYGETGRDSSKYLMLGDYVINVRGLPVIMGPRGFASSFYLEGEEKLSYEEYINFLGDAGEEDTDFIGKPYSRFPEAEKLVNRMDSRGFGEIYDFLSKYDKKKHPSRTDFVDAPKEKSWEERIPDAAMFDTDYYQINSDFNPEDLLTLQEMVLDSGQEILATYSALPFYDSPDADPSKPFIVLDRVVILNVFSDGHYKTLEALPGEWIVIQNGVAISILDNDQMGEIFGGEEI